MALRCQSKALTCHFKNPAKYPNLLLNVLGGGTFKVQAPPVKCEALYFFLSIGFFQLRTRQHARTPEKYRTWLFRAIHIFQVSRYGWGTGIREGAWQITSNLRSPLFASTPVLTSRAALWPSSRPTLRQNIFRGPTNSARAMQTDTTA